MDIWVTTCVPATKYATGKSQQGNAVNAHFGFECVHKTNTDVLYESIWHNWQPKSASAKQGQVIEHQPYDWSQQPAAAAPPAGTASAPLAASLCCQ